MNYTQAASRHLEALVNHSSKSNYGKKKRNNKETSATPFRRNYPSKQAINQLKKQKDKARKYDAMVAEWIINHFLPLLRQSRQVHYEAE